MRFELDQTWLSESGVSLTGVDLGVGVALGLVSPLSAVKYARRSVRAGVSDRMLTRLAEKAPVDAIDVMRLLGVEDSERFDLSKSESTRVWVYLQLKAAYALRSTLADPLGVVEQLYADFDYPPAVGRFVRYMPAQPGEPTGDEALMRKWEEYLANEGKALAKD